MFKQFVLLLLNFFVQCFLLFCNERARKFLFCKHLERADHSRNPVLGLCHVVMAGEEK